MDNGNLANITTKWGLVIESMLHDGKSIKWRNRLPTMWPNRSQDVDMHAVLAMELLLLLVHFIRLQKNLKVI